MNSIKPLPPALLVLEDGTIFHGSAYGKSGVCIGEVVFNTALSGYQEILTDPSYSGQIITLTAPHIGNVGACCEDRESTRCEAAGLILRNVSPLTSNWRAEQSLNHFLQESGVVALCNIDTRRLTRHLQAHGAQSGAIIAGTEASEALALAKQAPKLDGLDLAKDVTCQRPYTWTEGLWPGFNAKPTPPEAHVVVMDFGVKQAILRELVNAGFRLTVVPAMTSAQAVLALKPDGIFLSNGPGDPAACTYAIEAIQTYLAESIPLFGICLGYQLLALASGAVTFKMKFGHHGANHPVQELSNQRVFITSQNHGFAVEEASLPAHLAVTHRSLFDGTLQGLQHKEKPAFGVQGHPEASPGPREWQTLFQQFKVLIDA